MLANGLRCRHCLRYLVEEFMKNGGWNVMDRTRWGILSTAEIGTQFVIPAMQGGDRCEITAIASRSAEKAKNVASEFGIPVAYGSYQELLDDPDIDCIYNPLPNHLHVEWSIKALEAGKHVLCEKPVAVDTPEAEKLYNASREYPDLKVMEAFMYRHHPQWKVVKRILGDGSIGELQAIHATFTYYNTDPEDIRNRAEVGGGGLLDIGCYTISVSRFLFDSEPDHVFGVMEMDPEFNTDRLTSGILEFPEGRAAFTCATQIKDYQQVTLLGTKGRLVIELPFTPFEEDKCRLHLSAGEEVEVIPVEPADQYRIQGDLFSEAVLNDTEVPTPLEDALANMRVIDAVAESSESGGWVEV